MRGKIGEANERNGATPDGAPTCSQQLVVEVKSEAEYIRILNVILPVLSYAPLSIW